MGLYPNHGVEYHVVLSDGKTRIVVARTKETDDRLCASKYYKAREESWLTGEINCKQFVRPINDDEFDVLLTDDEQQKLKNILDNNTVETHGWFETNVISCSY